MRPERVRHDPATAPDDRAGQSALLSPDDVRYIVSVAGRAPSIHNTQPWILRSDGDVIEVLGDYSRLLRHVDPDGRELVISCGAALFGLRLALRKLGFWPAISILPEAAQPALLARARPGARMPWTAGEAELLAAVPHRHTHRGPFVPGEVPDRLLPVLAAEVTAEQSELVWVTDGALRAGLHDLVSRAAAEQQADRGIQAETQRWIVPAGSGRREGVPASACHPPGDASHAAAADSSALAEPQRRFSIAAGQDPTLPVAVLVTGGDEPADWLAAGQALHRVLLRAATRWVFASLQSQPLESPWHRSAVRQLLGLRGQPQMLLQFGRSNTALATPRRRYEDVLRTAGARA